MSEYFLSIDITDEASLLDACDYLHDATFTLSEAQYDQEARRWHATFVREFYEDPNLIEYRPAWLVFTRCIFPMVESILTLEGIEACEVVDNPQIDTFIFNECLAEGGRYVCLSCTGDEVSFVFSSEPKGTLRDVRLLDERGSILVWGRPKPHRGTALLS